MSINTQYDTPWEKYLSKNEWIFVAFVIIAGVLLRWINLDIRPFHHDEALYAVYGKYYYLNPAKDYYKYNPLLHGPLLYHLLPYVYQLIGMSKFAARSLITLLGTFFIFAPFIFKKYLSPKSFLISLVMISLSPSLIYWSRFLRHDYLVLFSLALMFWGYCFAKNGYKILLIIIGITLQFCIKENAYLTTFLLLFYIFIEHLLSFITKDRESLLKRGFNYLKKHPWTLVISIILSAIIYSYLFSAEFRYSAGIIDGLYRKSILYWFNQHSIERITGPFVYQFLNLSWYEFVLILFLFIHVIHFLIKLTWKFRLPYIVTILLAIICYFIFSRSDLNSYFLWSFFKLKIPIDIFLLFFLLIHGLMVTLHHLFNQEKQLSFWGYLFLSNFFLYSYVGEKVPWLSSYIFFFGLIYLVLYFQKNNLFKFCEQLNLKSVSLFHISLALIFLFNFRISLITNYGQAGSSSEFIGQVHTTQVYEKIILKIRDEINQPVNGRKPKILALSPNLWPTTWFLSGLHQYHHQIRSSSPSNYDYILADIHNPELEAKLLKTHHKMSIPLRAWWLPDYKRMTLMGYFKYAFFHYPWNKPGKQNISFFTKR